MQKSKSRTASSKKKPVVEPEPQPIIAEVEEKKKRGRKKVAEPAASILEPQPQPQPQPPQPQSVSDISSSAKKRASRKKTNDLQTEPVITPNAAAAAPDSTDTTTQPQSGMCHKKRGRKPKGGKVIQQLTSESTSINDAPNIILHLKCSVADIPNLNAAFAETSVKPGDVISFNALEPKGADLNDLYQPNGHSDNFIISSNSNAHAKPRTTSDALIATNSYSHLNDIGYDNEDDDSSCSENNLKEIWKKLNHLKLCFHKSDVFQNIGAGTRRSCCFWDTCEFDTPPIYIPKCISPNGGYTVYGCFCSPECAVAYLMKEDIDTSVKFERCQMLNSMYGRALNYDKSIKPAPNPQYILNKFYGNLSIQEYRKLFKSEQIIYVVNKPLTHILPEMYEDNNDFLLNNKVIPNNNYKLKKKISAFG